MYFLNLGGWNGWRNVLFEPTAEQAAEETAIFTLVN